MDGQKLQRIATGLALGLALTAYALPSAAQGTLVDPLDSLAPVAPLNPEPQPDATPGGANAQPLQPSDAFIIPDPQPDPAVPDLDQLAQPGFRSPQDGVEPIPDGVTILPDPLAPEADLPPGEDGGEDRRAQREAPPPPPNAPEGMTADEFAFEEALKALEPLNPEQQRIIRDAVQAARRGQSDNSLVPRAVRSASMTIPLDPGAQPPIIRLGAGEVTALAFFDVTGAPYPVASVVIGNPNKFSVEAPNEGGNLVTITPLQQFAYGNLVVSLAAQPIPLVYQLRAGTGEVFYRLDMRVQARGPLAGPANLSSDSDPVAGDPILTTFLDGLTPEGAQRIQVRGGQALAWLLDDQVYMRTPLTVISPGYFTRATGPAGMKVYRLPKAPVMRAVEDGRQLTLTLEGLD